MTRKLADLLMFHFERLGLRPDALTELRDTLDDAVADMEAVTFEPRRTAAAVRRALSPVSDEADRIAEQEMRAERRPPRMLRAESDWIFIDSWGDRWRLRATGDTSSPLEITIEQRHP
jgi:hypothetical protein